MVTRLPSETAPTLAPPSRAVRSGIPSIAKSAVVSGRALMIGTAVADVTVAPSETAAPRRSWSRRTRGSAPVLPAWPRARPLFRGALASMLRTLCPRPRPSASLASLAEPCRTPAPARCRHASATTAALPRPARPGPWNEDQDCSLCDSWKRRGRPAPCRKHHCSHWPPRCRSPGPWRCRRCPPCPARAASGTRRCGSATARRGYFLRFRGRAASPDQAQGGPRR
mmetsp:Transcript_37042/g.104514  ORF Transcript_37042/g.104514 Transcript_37042/m.104514 type:complete len:225 (+) Transcript_37042:819-1493(+)